MVMSEFITSGELSRTSLKPPASVPTDIAERNKALASYKSSAIWRLDLSCDCRLVAAAKATGEIEVFDTSTRTMVHRFVSHDGWVNVARFSADGEAIYCGGSDTLIRQFGLGGQPSMNVVGRHSRWINDLAIVQSSPSVFTVGADRFVRKWEAGNPAAILETKVSDANLWAITQLGTFLCIGDEDGWITIIDQDSGSIQSKWKAHNNCITSLSQGPELGTVCASSYDGTATIWAADGRELARFSGAGTRLWAACQISGTGAIASASDDGSVHIWRADNCGVIDVIRCGYRPIAIIDVAKEASLCIGCANGSIIWHYYGS